MAKKASKKKVPVFLIMQDRQQCGDLADGVREAGCGIDAGSLADGANLTGTARCVLELRFVKHSLDLINWRRVKIVLALENAFPYVPESASRDTLLLEEGGTILVEATDRYQVHSQRITLKTTPHVSSMESGELYRSHDLYQCFCEDLV